jgi:cation transport ATPase
MTMELSMTIALMAALGIGEVLTALVITAFVLVAEVLEDLTVSRGRRAIDRLLQQLPQRVRVRRNGNLADIPIDQLREADRVMVMPGARLPVDGVVIGGESFVDESSITGEAMPVAKREGTRVFAGTINQSGALEVRSERIGRNTTFGRIIEVVERAAHRRAPIQRIADRLAGYLVYVALTAAAVTWLVTRDARATISVSLVAGACRVAAGPPLAILGPNADPSTRSAAVVRHAREQQIMVPEPSRFSNVPGQGVSALHGSEKIRVGSSDSSRPDD